MENEVEKTREIEKKILGILQVKSGTIKVDDKKAIEKLVGEMANMLIEKIGAIKESRLENENLHKLIKDLKQEPIMTYANVTSGNTSKEEIAKEKYKITVKPKNIITCSETKQIILNAIDPTINQIKIDNIKNKENGKLIFECKTKEQILNLKEVINKELTDKIDVEINKKIFPRLIYRNIHLSVKEEELLDILYTQNKNIREKYEDIHKLKSEIIVKYSFNRKTRKGIEYKNIVIETKTNKARNMLKQELSIKWQNREAEDHINIKRCYKCLDFGHIAKDCKELQDKCAICTGNHKQVECNNREQKKCINCVKENKRNTNKQYIDALDSNHNTYDTKCPIYQRIKRILEENIAYNE